MVEESKRNAYPIHQRSKCVCIASGNGIVFASSAIQVHSSYRDWADNVSLLNVDTSDCMLGTIDYPDGSDICLHLFHFAGCVFDTVSPINLDEIIPELGNAVNEFMNDPVGSVVRFVAEEINEAIDDLQTCVKGLSGQLPKCSGLATFSACVSTAANVLTGLKATKAVGLVEVKRLEKGLDKIGTALSFVGDQCRLGCQGGVCSADSRTFTAPSSCQCKTMTLALDWEEHVTPDDCARNTATFKTGTWTDSLALSSKVSFTYMGCYVGTDGDVDEWSRSCPEAYASNVFDGAWFVRCVDQDGQTLLLPDDVQNSSGGGGTVGSPKEIQRHIQRECLACMPKSDTVILLLLLSCMPDVREQDQVRTASTTKVAASNRGVCPSRLGPLRCDLIPRNSRHTMRIKPSCSSPASSHAELQFTGRDDTVEHSAGDQELHGRHE